MMRAGLHNPHVHTCVLWESTPHCVHVGIICGVVFSCQVSGGSESVWTPPPVLTWNLATTSQHHEQVSRLCLPATNPDGRVISLEKSTCHFYLWSGAPGFSGWAPRAHLEWLMRVGAGHSISQGPQGKHRKPGQSSAIQGTGGHIPTCSTCVTISLACCTTCWLLLSGQGCSWGEAC